MKNNTDFSEKFSQMLEHIGISKHDLAKKLGYERSQSIYDIANGKSKPSFDFFNKLFSSEYSELFNPLWIFADKGEMLVSEKYVLDEFINIAKANETKLEYNISNGFKSLVLISSENNREYVKSKISREKLLKKLPVYTFPIGEKGDFRIFQIEGINMHPTLPDKSLLIGKNIEDWEEVKEDTVVVIISNTEGLLVTRVQKNMMSKGLLLCKNDAVDSEEFGIKSSEIQEIWIFNSALISEISETSYLNKKLNFLELELLKVKEQIKGG